MRKKISKRIEALQREADKEAFATRLCYAVAYYLGGARDPSEMVLGLIKAYGYRDHWEIAQALLDLRQQPSDSVANRRTHERIGRARCQLFAKFGYDLRRISPAALDDAAYRVVRTLPEEWLADIRSAHRNSRETDIQFKAILKEMQERQR